MEQEDIPQKYFFYCCQSKVPCSVNTQTKDFLQFFGENDYFYEEKYHFRQSILKGPEDYYDLTFMFFPDSGISEPFTQSVRFNTKEEVIGYIMVPFIVFDVKDINILYHFDTTTLSKLTNNFRLWLNENNVLKQ